MTLALLATGAAVLYAAACWVWPFGRCKLCSGKGTGKTLFLRRPRPCRLCKGSGLRLRLGRRAYNYGSRIHWEATKRRRAARS